MNNAYKAAQWLSNPNLTLDKDSVQKLLEDNERLIRHDLARQVTNMKAFDHNSGYPLVKQQDVIKVILSQDDYDISISAFDYAASSIKCAKNHKELGQVQRYVKAFVDDEVLTNDQELELYILWNDRRKLLEPVKNDKESIFNNGA